MIFAFDAVLIDIDGTLIDSNGAHAETWQQSLSQHGHVVDLVRLRSLIGMGGDKLLPTAAGIDADSVAGRSITARKKDLFTERLPHLRATHGARVLLSLLKQFGVPVVVATSADDEETRALLTQAGVDDLIPQTTTKDDAEASKPDPDIVIAALRKVGSRAERTVLVGDTPYDIAAGHGAGVGVLAVRSGGHWSDAQLGDALHIYDDPQALADRWIECGHNR